MNPETENSPVRVLIVDDHPAVCQGLALLLKTEDITVCSEAGGCAEALARVDECRPDVAVVDILLGEENGLVLVSELHRRELPCLVYSMYEDGQHVERAFAAGALGYVTKREIQGVLVQAIHEVAAGRRFISPRAALALANQVSRPSVDRVDLSHQEHQVYSLLGTGEGTTEIARQLNISPRTVESYYARILTKLNLDGMRELRRHAIQQTRGLSGNPPT